MPPCYPTHHPPSPCATSLLSYAPSHHGTFLCNLATTKVLRTLLSQVYNNIVKLSMLLYYSCRYTLDLTKWEEEDKPPAHWVGGTSTGGTLSSRPTPPITLPHPCCLVPLVISNNYLKRHRMTKSPFFFQQGAARLLLSETRAMGHSKPG